MCSGDIGGVWRFVCLRDQFVYLHAFGPGPRWVDGCVGFPNEPEVWAAWVDEAGCKAEDAGGATVEIEESLYSFEPAIGV